MGDSGASAPKSSPPYEGCGLRDSSIFSKITWSWVRRLIDIGESIGESDFDRLDTSDEAQTIEKELSARWEEELRNPQPSLTRVLIAMFGLRFALLAVMLVIYNGALILQPLMLREIVNFISTPSAPDWYGYVYASVLVAGVVCQGVIHHQYFFEVSRLAIQARTGVTALVYRKALKLTSSSFSQTTTGQVVNMASSDVSKFDEFLPFAHYLWMAPVLAAVVWALIWQQVGVASVFGFVVLLALIPLQIYFARQFSAIRKDGVGATDRRVKTVNEILVGASIMKMYNWEDSLEKVVFSARAQEFGSIQSATRLRAINQGISFFALALVSFVTFVGYIGLGNTLVPAKVFSTISLYFVVRVPLTMFFVFAMEKFSDVRVSMHRLNSFLTLSAMNEVKKDDKGTDAPLGSITIRGADFSWQAPPEPSAAGEPLTASTPPTIVLSDINLNIEPGTLVAVVGPIGSSKSSLLAALLHELHQLKGTVSIGGSVALSAQKAWILASSVRDNIVFERAYDEERYRRVLECCELAEDIKNLHAGDLTEIGERGVNLSGGQKARVALARAVYGDFPVYLFDDPLAAVDGGVGRRLFDQVISNQGLLKGRTRVLVTHHTYLLNEVDYIVVLDQGRVRFSGTFAELLQSNIDLKTLLHESGHTDQNEETDALASPPKEAAEEEKKELDMGDVKEEEKVEEQSPEPAEPKNEEQNPLAKKTEVVLATKGDQDKIIRAEDKAQGAVGNRVFASLFRAAGGNWVAVVTILLMSASQALSVLCDWWLAYLSRLSSTDQSQAASYYIYAIIVGLLILLSLGRTLFFFSVAVKAAAFLHDRMFRGVLYSPMRFFEANPTGRILNRFSKDQSITDELFPMTIYDVMQCTFMVCGTLVVIGVSNPYALLSTIPVIPAFLFIRRKFLLASREVKRIDAMTRSPIYALFSSTLNGLMTVRAFGVQEVFAHKFLTVMDANTRAFHAFQYINRWFGFRLDMISCCVTLATCYAAVAVRNSISPSVAGLSLTYALQITSIFQWGVRQSAEAENQLTSVERLQEYGDLPPEGDRVIEGKRPPPEWPQKGEIVFDNVQMRYREGLDLVLKGVDAHIKPSEKIGVCGRTGAGKSSLFGVLFRLTQPCGGRIVIDGINTLEIGLSDLRSKLSIIPQEPVIFSGTLRYNLDPFDYYTDQQIWASLEEVNLADSVRALKDGLNTVMAEYGGNFSVGECQLICVARAILKPSKILLVDEATANVDRETDRLIQSVIRDKFKDRTVITIAHRLNTILDSTRIIVMKKGKVDEFDIPENISVVQEQKELDARLKKSKIDDLKKSF
eukprot:TRINITY_DN848_c0_g1_i5.p1 TRINITY_DN848_c0_g1~~TRINITY_DN848_c0_g1_i5.p1  ORF type:complete len:1312 (-),score=307.44 TRINITY_DN848_c0_g1_i5:62-3997(-)